MSKLKFYYDLLSQPSRTLNIFLLTTKIPFDAHEIRLGKGEHRSEEYRKIYKMQTVPAIVDGDFVLGESVGILRYLCRERKVADHWYPKDSKARAKVDEYVEWQHLGTRLHCAYYFRATWLEPLSSKKPPKPEFEAFLKKNMVECCDMVEKVWLDKKPFLCGEQISIADLLAATELEQPKLAGYDPREGRPDLTSWFERVREATAPHYDISHAVLNATAKKFGGKCPALIANP